MLSFHFSECCCERGICWSSLVPNGAFQCYNGLTSGVDNALYLASFVGVTTPSIVPQHISTRISICFLLFIRTAKNISRADSALTNAGYPNPSLHLPSPHIHASTFLQVVECASRSAFIVTADRNINRRRSSDLGKLARLWLNIGI